MIKHWRTYREQNRHKVNQQFLLIELLRNSRPALAALCRAQSDRDCHIEQHPAVGQGAPKSLYQFEELLLSRSDRTVDCAGTFQKAEQVLNQLKGQEYSNRLDTSPRSLDALNEEPYLPVVFSSD